MMRFIAAHTDNQNAYCHQGIQIALIVDESLCLVRDFEAMAELAFRVENQCGENEKFRNRNQPTPKLSDDDKIGSRMLTSSSYALNTANHIFWLLQL